MIEPRIHGHDNVCMFTNNPHTRITWSGDDRIDPYPAILEALNEVFEFAKAHEGSIGKGPETQVINNFHRVAIGTLAEYDRNSLPMFTADTLEENS